MEWVSRINHALETNQFKLWYQLIEPLSVLPGIHPKLEILIRMEQEDGSIIVPALLSLPPSGMGSFLRLIAGFENTIKAWVHLKEQNHELVGRLFSINLSGATLLDETFIDFAINITNQYGANPANFCLEITETSAIQNLSFASRFIEK